MTMLRESQEAVNNTQRYLNNQMALDDQKAKEKHEIKVALKKSECVSKGGNWDSAYKRCIYIVESPIQVKNRKTRERIERRFVTKKKNCLDNGGKWSDTGNNCTMTYNVSGHPGYAYVPSGKDLSNPMRSSEQPAHSNGDKPSGNRSEKPGKTKDNNSYFYYGESGKDKNRGNQSSGSGSSARKTTTSASDWKSTTSTTEITTATDKPKPRKK